MVKAEVIISTAARFQLIYNTLGYVKHQFDNSLVYCYQP